MEQETGKTQYVALLRGINVGGNNRVPMAELRELMIGLEFEEPRTLIQSGNAVFHSVRSAGEAETALEGALEQRYGRRIAVMVRSAEEWRRMVAANPFAAEAAEDGAKVFVHCLKAPVDEAEVRAFNEQYSGPERLVASRREVFVHYPGGIGRSELKAKFLAGGTARNWNTVLRLAAMLAA